MKAYRQKAAKPYICSKCGKEIKSGEEYIRISGFHAWTQIRCTKCGYTRSDLTTSDYLKWLYDLQDNTSEMFEESEELANDIASELESKRDELQDSYDNIPESLQQGAVAEIIQERIDNLDSAIDDLYSLDYPDMSDFDEDSTDNLDENGDPVLSTDEEEEYLEAVNAYYESCYEIINGIAE